MISKTMATDEENKSNERDYMESDNEEGKSYTIADLYLHHRHLSLNQCLLVIVILLSIRLVDSDIEMDDPTSPVECARVANTKRGENHNRSNV